MDERLRSVATLFEIEAYPWQPTQRDFGRLADGAIVPEDIVIEANP